jgi:hypothetical protein
MAKLIRARGAATKPLIRVFIQDNSVTTGIGKIGLTSASSGLAITAIREQGITATPPTSYAYTVDGGTIETITTIGVYAEPTNTKCGFKVVDAANFPGLYEIAFPSLLFSDALVDATDHSRFITVMVYDTGVGLTIAPCLVEIQLSSVDLSDGIRFGLTALPAYAPGAAGGLMMTGGSNLGTTTLAALTVTGATTLTGGMIGDITLPAPAGCALSAFARPRIRGAVVADAGNGISDFKTDLAETTTDYWKGCYVRLTSGAMIGQMKKILTYSATKIITVESPFTATPVAAVTFDIINV